MPIDENVSSHLAARGMLQLATKDLISSLSALVFFVVIARFLPDINQLGILVGLQTIIVMFVLLSGLGLPYAATRFISTYVGSNQTGRAERLYPLIFVLSMILSAIFSAVLFVFSHEVSQLMFHDAKLTQLVQLTALDVFFLGMATSCTSLLSASMEFTKIARIWIIASLLKYFISFLFFMNGLWLYGIMLGLALGDAIAAITLAFSLVHRIFGTKVSIISFFLDLGPILRFALSLYGWIILNFFLSRIDVYLLMIFSNLYLVGLYGPAVFVASAFLILLAAMDQALLPMTSRIYGKHGTTYFKYSSTRATRFLFLFYFPVGFAIAASSPTLVTMIMGQRFAESVYPIVIIVIAITLTSPGVFANNLLRSAGYTGVALKAGAAALLVQVLISLIMIPQFGVIAVSSARLISYFVFMIPVVYKLNRIGGFEFDRRVLAYGLIGSVIIAMIIIVTSAVEIGPYSLVLQYVLAFWSYILFLRIARAIRQEDLELVDKVFMGKIKWLTRPLAKIIIQ